MILKPQPSDDDDLYLRHVVYCFPRKCTPLHWKCIKIPRLSPVKSLSFSKITSLSPHIESVESFFSATNFTHLHLKFNSLHYSAHLCVFWITWRFCGFSFSLQSVSSLTANHISQWFGGKLPLFDFDGFLYLPPNSIPYWVYFSTPKCFCFVKHYF